MSKEELPDIKVSIVDEATEETTSNEKSEDEIDKTEIDEELVEESIKDEIEIPSNPAPSRRGKRRRRGTSRRPMTQERPQVKKVEKVMVKTDSGEIEMTQNSKSLED